MAHFRFFFFDALGAAKESTIGEQASDSEAIAEAERRLIGRCELAAVEIWRGSRLVQALKRGGERWMSVPLGRRLTLHPLFEPEFSTAA
jgi:hypothetical protein